MNAYEISRKESGYVFGVCHSETPLEAYNAMLVEEGWEPQEEIPDDILVRQVGEPDNTSIVVEIIGWDCDGWPCVISVQGWDSQTDPGWEGISSAIMAELGDEYKEQDPYLLGEAEIIRVLRDGWVGIVDSRTGRDGRYGIDWVEQGTNALRHDTESGHTIRSGEGSSQIFRPGDNGVGDATRCGSFCKSSK